MYWRYLYHSLIIIFVWLMQVSFISVLPSPLNHLNLALVSILILLLFDDLNLLFFWTILSSYLLAMSSRLPLGVLLPAWWLVAISCYAILNQFLTNRSLYSLLLLVLGGTVSLEIFTLIGSYIYKLFTGLSIYSALDLQLLTDLSHAIVLNSIAMLTLFYFMSAINSKLKPFLLLKRKV
jgi:hypothetical protein